MLRIYVAVHFQDWVDYVLDGKVQFSDVYMHIQYIQPTVAKQ